jgi:hypothetical protein
MPVETRIQLRQGSDATWTSTSVATITNAVAANGVITYTASNSFVVGSKVTVVGINPPALNVTDLTVLTATGSNFTVTSANTGTYVSGGTARNVLLAAGELGYAQTSGTIGIGDGATYWAGLKKLAWSNATQTFVGNQTFTPTLGNGNALTIRGKADRTYTIYRGVASVSGGINTYYVTTPIIDSDAIGGEFVTITGFAAAELNLVAASIASIAGNGLSFTVYSSIATDRDVTAAGTAVFKELDTANGGLSSGRTLFEVYNNENTRLAYIDRQGTFRINGPIIGESFETLYASGANSSLFDLGATYSAITNASVIVGSNGSTTTGQIGIESATGSTSTRYHISFTNGAVVGRISTSGSATSYTTSSDYRLKENVVPISNASERLLELKPVKFNWIAQPEKSIDGFIAHEVQDIVPEAIDGEKDAVDSENKIVPQGIDQSKLVPLLTAALQEALLRIEALEAKVN